ncbi:ribosomal protein S6 kinase delta-1 isoform X1 [Hippocampus zosterae]|uniref:ribosomal protein S6 kinase delta-1 isoform X1 n=1 Tax=Hippocampus zosterae TaxID=109293 RepID=UPI00223E7F37|nr:ribosomal protein S6 kinase delta-1 isoform X1 [Hippocampus zosterae]
MSSHSHWIFAVVTNLNGSVQLSRLLAFGNVVSIMISQRDSGDFARFYTVTEPTKHRKGYTVYKVTARIISRKNPEDVQEITVWKRYSDFRKLHHNLWQLHKKVCSQSELFPPFAKAKVFGRFDDSVIEERRQCLEDLLQFSANIPALYSSQHIQEFFKGGEVHDSSELIGPSEPFSEFLADTLSDSGSDVQRYLSCTEDLTFTSEYGGPSSESSDLVSLAVDTDSLAELDDGMALGCNSPKQPHGGAASISSNSSSSPRLPSAQDHCSPPSPALSSPGSLAPKPEVSRPGRGSLFSKRAGGLKEKLKADYLDKAGELIRVAAQKEKDHDYRAAFSFYRSGVDLLLQGVQGEPSPTRREAVKKKTAEYLMRAEQISSQYLGSNMGQGSTQTLMMGAPCCSSTSGENQPSLSDDLAAYRVLGVIDKVLLVMDKRTREMFVMKGLRKSSDCSQLKKNITPRSVPHMVHLKKLMDSEDTVFLLLQHAEGGKLWSHIGKYLRNSNLEESFDIPFIQKSHTVAVHSLQCAAPQPAVNSAISGSGPAPCCSDSALHVNKEVDDLAASPCKSGLFARLRKKVLAHTDSGATSEEECTNSYLTLCNEYEQEKVEPGALEVDDDARSEQEVSFDVATGTATASSRSRSLLSNDSLSSPVGCRELGFFADPRDGRRDGEGLDPGDALRSSPSSAEPLSLDQSKHTPMEFFRIDSKDSASEVTCQDWEQQQQQPPASQKVFPDLPELAPKVEGHNAQLWGLDYSDKGSNESVPVISFKEAAAEDEGHPPDLLVNLPVISGAADSQQVERETCALHPGLKVTTSPQRSIKPDVLQLPGQSEREEEQQPSSLCAASAKCDPGVASSSGLTSLQDDSSLTLGQKRKGKIPVQASCQNNESLFDAARPAAASLSDEAMHTDVMANIEAQACENSTQGSAESSAVRPDAVEFDNAVSRLFAELDELSLAASQARIPEAFVRCWAVELVTALDCLHQEGIICRDLNPNNILLDRQGHVQLTYFCSWSDVEESCDKEAIANMYCAPEVGGIGEETAACDWWSLGAILFELLTSMVLCPPPPDATAPASPGSAGCPFPGFVTLLSLLQCHPAGIGRHTALNIPESVSEEACSLLEQLLQYNPTERLGAGVAGVDDIKSHPFFAKVDWTK